MLDLIRSRSTLLKLAGAVALLTLWAVVGARSGAASASWSPLPMMVLAVMVGGVALLLWRATTTRAALAERPEALRVVSRVGLARHVSAALLEAGGKRWLVVHGEQFAEIRDADLEASSDGEG